VLLRETNGGYEEVNNMFNKTENIQFCLIMLKEFIEEEERIHGLAVYWRNRLRMLEEELKRDKEINGR
jgi:hypothetical protein